MGSLGNKVNLRAARSPLAASVKRAWRLLIPLGARASEARRYGRAGHDRALRAAKAQRMAQEFLKPFFGD